MMTSQNSGANVMTPHQLIDLLHSHSRYVARRDGGKRAELVRQDLSGLRLKGVGRPRRLRSIPMDIEMLRAVRRPPEWRFPRRRRSASASDVASV